MTPERYQVVDQQGFHDGSAFVLTAINEVLHVTTAAPTFESVLQDDLLTDVSLSWNGPGTSPALFVVHGSVDELSLVGELITGTTFYGGD